MAKKPKATGGVSVQSFIPVYTAATALADTSVYITDLADVENSKAEIINYIIDAAQVRKATSLTVRASNGVVDRNSPEFIEIRNWLRDDLGYTVRVNNRTDTAEIFWG